MKYTHRMNPTRTGTIYTFSDGTTLESANVTFPPRYGIGPMSFPIRHVGDVFHAFRMAEVMELSASLIPSPCRAW